MYVPPSRQPTSPNLTHRSASSDRPELLILGETDFRSARQRFGQLPEDRLRHLWVLGKTGSGKSTLLANLIVQDLQAGRGVAVLDPHGSLVDVVARQIPKARTNQVLWLDPSDREYPVSFNPFRQGREPHTSPALLASELIAIFKKQWSDSWGPRLEHVLRNAILAVSSDPRASLLLLYRFLIDEGLRSTMLPKITDPVVRQFWSLEFESYGKRLQGEAIAPVLNKLGAFISQPLVRNILGQERSRVDIPRLMREQGILLANLATGRIGEDASHLLGGLLFSTIQLAGNARGTSEPPFYVYADEWQHFVTESLTTVLAESRKFGIGFTFAHQYLGQLPLGLRDAVFGNVGSMVVFRLGAEDALTLEPELFPPFTKTDLDSLGRYKAAVRVVAGGRQLMPFSARMLPPHRNQPDGESVFRRAVLQSRRRHCRPRAAVELGISKTMGAK